MQEQQQEITKRVKVIPWTPRRLRDILSDAGALRVGISPSLCVGCPNRAACEKGFAERYYVRECGEHIDRQATISTIARQLGVPEQRLEA